ncbi:MAG: hypothetical protein V1858_02130 [Candidatus Gottesmanbacteria bacterium]
MITIRNISAVIPNESGINIDQKKARDSGVVTVVLEGVSYTIGQNATLTLPDRLANMAIAQNSNLVLINRS